jgi:hypothetical protein
MSKHTREVERLARDLQNDRYVSGPWAFCRGVPTPLVHNSPFSQRSTLRVLQPERAAVEHL